MAGAAYFFREKDNSLNKEYLAWKFVGICGCFFFIDDLIYGINNLFVTYVKNHLADQFITMGVILVGTAIIRRIYHAEQINSK